MHLAILGAGPIGIESAVAAQQMGHTVTVLERGVVGQGVLSWGHVTMFTPWHMNTTERGRALLGLGDLQDAGFPTGDSYVHDYLAPLARGLDVRTNTRVVGVGKSGIRKGQMLGSPDRLQAPFEVLTVGGTKEETLRFDAVIDCTGVSGQPAPAGASGLPVPGEREAARSGHLSYGTVRRALPEGCAALLIGDGASAVTELARMLDEDTVSRVYWITPSCEVPGFASPADDPLPSRQRLFHFGHEAPHHPKVELLPGAHVQAFRTGADGLHVVLSTDSVLEVQAVMVCTGFRPDLDLLRELQAHWCWGTDGPMKLSATLLSNASGDCLQAPASGAEALLHPEPRLFVLGAKSYGRRSDFLLTRGHAQVVDALQLLARS